MELIICPPPAARDALPTMATPLLPPSASSAMSAAAASALSRKDQGSRRQIPVMAARGISRRHRHRHRRCFRRRHISLSFAGWLSRRCLHLSSSRLCLRFSLLNAHRGPVASSPLVPLYPFASRSSAGCHVACCRVPPPRVTFCCAAASRVHP